MTDRPARPSTDGFSEAKRTPSAASRSKPKGSGRDSRQRRPPDYVVIGHICADILPDGTAVLGGTALYSALAAATLGWRTGILTRGRYGFDLNGLDIPPLTIGSERIQIVVQDAEWPTCFVNEYAPSGRRTQQIARWAGPIDLRGLPPSWHTARVIHLGPIAQEIDVRQATGLNPQFLGTTPQGWMRDWPRATGGRVQPTHLRLPPELVSQLDGIVVNDEEFGFSRDMVEAVGKHGYGVVTLGENGAKAFTPKGRHHRAGLPRAGGGPDRRRRCLFGIVLLPDCRPIDHPQPGAAVRPRRCRAVARWRRREPHPDPPGDPAPDAAGRRQRLTP